MIDPKTAPDPQIGSNPELLALCQEHIDNEATLRDALRVWEGRATRRRLALQSIERQLGDIGALMDNGYGYGARATIRRLAQEAKRAYTD